MQKVGKTSSLINEDIDNSNDYILDNGDINVQNLKVYTIVEENVDK